MTRDPSDPGVGRPSPLDTPGGQQSAAIDDELQNLSYTLEGAGDDVVREHMTRLHAQADKIADARWRDRAHRHIDHLPRDIGGPKPGESPQYWEATALVQRYLGTEYTDAAVRMSDGEETMQRVGDLARAAPPEEETLILGMNGAVNRKIMWTD